MADPELGSSEAAVQGRVKAIKRVQKAGRVSAGCRELSREE